MLTALRLFLATLIIGIGSGLLIVLYVKMSEGLRYLLFFGDPLVSVAYLPWWYLFLVPFAAMIVIHLIIAKYPIVQEYGVKTIAEAVASNRMVMGIKEVLLKIFASSLSLASGFNVGNEGPAAEIGAIFGSIIQRLFKFPRKMTKVLLGIGASSGIAAVFVSPITGIIFAFEQITYSLGEKFIIYLILGSTLAFSIAISFLAPIVFTYSIGKTILYSQVLFSLLFIPFAGLFIYIYYFLKDGLAFWIDRLIQRYIPKWRNIIFMGFGVSVTGILLNVSPYAAFSGHEVVEYLINAQAHMPFIFVLLLAILRIIGLVFSLYAKAVGGVFISLMSIGALVGYAYAEIVDNFFFAHLEPFYYAAIGAAVFVGVVMRLPLASVVMALELTYDYNVIVPTALSVSIIIFVTALHLDLHKHEVMEIKK